MKNNFGKNVIADRLVNGFLVNEFRDFKELYKDRNNRGSEQDLRSLSMLWVCKFLKSFVRGDFGIQVHNFVDEVMNEKDYRSYGWSWISSLQAISYLFTSNKEHLDDLLLHASCNQSTIREVILKSCGVIIDDISVKNETLKYSAERNLNLSHGLYKQSTILYLCSSGGWKIKKRWFLKMKKEHETYHRDFLNTLQKQGKHFKDGYYLETFSQAKSYFIFKTLSNPEIVDHQSEMLPLEKNDNALLQTLRDTENNHPLTGHYIDLSFLEDEKFRLFKQE